MDVPPMARLVVITRKVPKDVVLLKNTGITFHGEYNAPATLRHTPTILRPCASNTSIQSEIIRVVPNRDRRPSLHRN